MKNILDEQINALARVAREALEASYAARGADPARDPMTAEEAIEQARYARQMFVLTRAARHYEGGL